MGFTVSIAQVLMTLSALAYVEDDAPTKKSPPPPLSAVANGVGRRAEKPHLQHKKPMGRDVGPNPIQPNTQPRLSLPASAGPIPMRSFYVAQWAASHPFAKTSQRAKHHLAFGLPADAKVSIEIRSQRSRACWPPQIRLQTPYWRITCAPQP